MNEGSVYKEALKDLGISITQCAKDIGVSRPSLSHCLNGKWPMYPHYKKLLDLYIEKMKGAQV